MPLKPYSNNLLNKEFNPQNSNKSKQAYLKGKNDEE